MFRWTRNRKTKKFLVCRIITSPSRIWCNNPCPAEPPTHQSRGCALEAKYNRRVLKLERLERFVLIRHFLTPLRATSTSSDSISNYEATSCQSLKSDLPERDWVDQLFGLRTLGVLLLYRTQVRFTNTSLDNLVQLSNWPTPTAHSFTESARVVDVDWRTALCCESVTEPPPSRISFYRRRLWTTSFSIIQWNYSSFACASIKVSFCSRCDDIALPS